MLCSHLEPLEKELLRQGHALTFRGQPWSQNCREWVYFDCVLPIAALREQFSPPACVVDHEHRGTHDGEERGLVCTEHKDGVMGRLVPEPLPDS